MRIKLFLCVGFSLLSTLAANEAFGQFSTVYNLPPDPDFGDSVTIGSDTQVNLFAGGMIGDFFYSGSTSGTDTNIEVNVFGGEIGVGMRAYGGSTINISGGHVGNSLRAYAGSVVNISGGQVDSSPDAYSGSVINVSGGNVGTFLGTRSGGVINVTGGEIRSIRNRAGGTYNVHGGYLGTSGWVFDGSTMTMDGGNIGSGFQTDAGAVVELKGGEFLLDGVAVSGTVNLATGSILTGTLEDGSVFIFNSINGDNIADGTITLTNTSVPGNFNMNGLRSGQTLNLSAGDSLQSGFGAVGGTLNMAGGSIGDYMEAYDSVITVNGGSVGYGASFIESAVTVTGGTFGPAVRVYDGSVMDVQGGDFEFSFGAYSGSEINVSGGSFENGVNAYNGSQFNISGGQFDGVRARSGSTMTMTGGSIGGRLDLDSSSQTTISGGSFGKVDADFGGSLDIRGGDFFLDGVAVSGMTNMAGGSLLTGVLEDGSVFMLRQSVYDDTVDSGTLNLIATSVAPTGPPIVDVNSDVAPNSIRDGQVLNLFDGGILGPNFAAIDATMNIEGGEIGTGMEIANTLVNMSGGSIDRDLAIYAGSEFNQSGGTIEEGIIEVHSGAEFTLTGTKFLVGGVDITDSLTLNQPLLITNRGVVLSGLLADGSEFSYDLNFSQSYEADYFSINAMVFVSLAVPEPGCALAGLAGFVLVVLRTRNRKSTM